MAATGPTATLQLRFDRGTILLEGDRAAIASLDCAVWDPRVDSCRAPAFRYPAILRAARVQGWALVDPIRPAPVDGGAFRPLGLRPYQEAAVEAWEQSAGRGLVVRPTGAGKTRVALAAIARCGTATLILVPTIALLDQWCAQLSAATSASIGRLGDGIRRVEALTVATYESAYRQMGQIGDRFGLLVVDEAHHFGARQRDEVLEMAVAERRLGLTATPPEAPEHRAAIERLIGPLVYERGLLELAGSHLAPLSRVRVLVDLEAEERLRYRSSYEVFLDFQRAARLQHPHAKWQDLVRIGGRSVAGRRALSAFREVRRIVAYPRAKARQVGRLLGQHPASRALVFCADNQAAYAIAKDHLIMPITCDIGRVERQQVFQRFAAGELRALVSARVLNEGIDLPEADLAIVVSGAFGAREHVQRIGRVLRPQPGKEALLYELVCRGTVETTWAARRSRGLHS
ncbi:MAG: DEAD/DEAH box helicase family protein [Deltaproteobacteria bacterium]|nr:DEAD/DEAH box helicase family protein [Deltaproteobacteria bacterium]